jgi:predicted nucleic acid-binding protein
MPFVVDASVTAAWMLPDEDSPHAEYVHSLLTEHSASVPAVWWYEIRNLLVMAERQKRIAPTASDAALARLAVYPIVVDHEFHETSILDIARRHKLTVYDASYIELATRLRLPVATLDRRMAEAATAASIDLVVAI